MTARLTLTIEQSVINKAKAYAQKKGHSLSDLVENYLKSLNDKEDISPRVKRLKGAIKLPENFEYKKSLEEELVKKYSK